MCSQPAGLAPQPGTSEDADTSGGGGCASATTHLPGDEVSEGHPGGAGGERHLSTHSHPSPGHPHCVSKSSKLP